MLKDYWLPSVASFLLSGLVMGALAAAQTGSVAIGFVTGLASGGFFTAAMLRFVVLVQRARVFGLTEIQGWAPDEVVLRSGPANIMRRGVAEGGKLFLTNKRLRFHGHRAALEVADVSFPVSQIASVERCRTLGFIPNGLRIAMADGRRVQFVVGKPGEWVAAINQPSTKFVAPGNP